MSYFILSKFNRVGDISSSLLQSARCTRGGDGARTGTTAVVGGGGRGAGPGAGPIGSAVGRDMLGLDLGLELISPAFACKKSTFLDSFKKRALVN